MIDERAKAFSLENSVRRSLHYLDSMVDKDCQPYFNIFMTIPAEAAHDWPDFGDVMSRQLQAAVFAGHMTGYFPVNTDKWREKLFSYIDKNSGLLFRPETHYSRWVADPGDQALTLFTLLTLYEQSKSDQIIAAAMKMTDGLSDIISLAERTKISWLHGFAIKSLMVFYRLAGYDPALRLAGRLTKAVIEKGIIMNQENKLVSGAHMHGSLRVLSGVADYALYTGDLDLFKRMEESFRFITGIMTRFGFLPEVYARKDDIIACETCALMDYIGLGSTLAVNGYPQYWSCVERMVRNHLTESQTEACSWLVSSATAGDDTAQFSYRDIGARMAGGYAGWSSPNHILACNETLNDKWGGLDLRDKIRAFQNCCGGSGVHAFFTAWKNASRYLPGTLYVNLHIDKLLPEAEIRCFQPYQGLLLISMKKACNLKIRIPDFVSPDDFVIIINGKKSRFITDSVFAVLRSVSAGDHIEVHYPLPVIDEDITVGNPGFKKYGYRVRWRGDTVISMTPSGKQYQTAYSASEGREIPVYYGNEGPGLLYQRDALYSVRMPECSVLTLDRGRFDYYGCL